MSSPTRPAAFPLAASFAIALCLAAPWSPRQARADGARGAAESKADPAATVSAGGVTLKSAAVSLPASDRMYPDGAHAEVINNNCLTCHSAGMVLTQPRLDRDEWQAEVTKMVKVYKAPVAPEDAVLIVDYLAQLKPPR